MGSKFIRALVFGVIAIGALLFLSSTFPLLFPILVIGGLVFAVVAGKTVLPSWREKYPAWTGKGAVARVVYGISTGFVSVWFAGALLARSMIGRAILTWIIVALVIDFVYVSPTGDAVEPLIIGWTGLALLSGLYGWSELRNQRRWESLVARSHETLKGQYRSDDVPVRFKGRMTGSMDYSFGVPPSISRGDLFDIEEQLRQRVPTHRNEMVANMAKKYPVLGRKLKTIDKAFGSALAEQESQRDRTWRYRWDLEDHQAFAEVIPGVPRLVTHPATEGKAGTLEHPKGDPYRIPVGVGVDGIEYWDVRDLYGGLLVAGQIGGGKSVLLRALIIYAILHHRSWDIYLIDPKVTELAPYRDFPQVLAGAATFSRTRVCVPLSAPRSTLAARNGFSRFWLSDGWNMLAVGDSEQHRRAIRCGTVARTIAQIF